MSLFGELRARAGLGAVLDHMIPSHANDPTYVVGGSIVVLGLLQGITGVLLQQFYHPMPDQSAAYASVKYIVNIPIWNFVRNLHYWGAQLILVLVILHMLRVFVSASYKKPRELLWAVGVALLVISWLLLFTGTVLKWDQEGVEALGHNLEMASFAGPLGYWFVPSFASDVPILIRINSAHVTILPMIALVLVGAHLYLIRVLGISSPQSSTKHLAEQKQVPFSTHLKKMLVYGLLAVLLVAVLASTVQAPFSSLGNPAIEVSKPDWYLLWIYAVENFQGLQAVPPILTVALILILFLPAFDRSPETDPKKRKVIIAFFIIAIILFAGLTTTGALIPPKSHLG